MNHTAKSKIRFFAVTVLLAIPLFMASTPAANAQDGLKPLIIISPGGAEVFNFYVNDMFSLETFGPLAATAIVAYGEGSGTLTLTLECKAKSSDFLFKMSFMMTGFSYILNGTPAPIVASKNTPLKIVQKVPINSNFGLVAIGMIVTGVDNPGDFLFPAPFTLTVELSKAEPTADLE